MTPKTLAEAKAYIKQLESKLGVRSDVKPLDNPYKNPGKPQKLASDNPNPRPLNPRATIAAGNRSSLDAARSDIKAANGYKAKLSILEEVEANIMRDFNAAKNAGSMKDMTAANRRIAEVQLASAKLMLAEKTELGPRASRAQEILRRNDLD